MLIDLLIGLVYMFVILFILYLYADRKYRNNSYKKRTFLLALILKLSASLLFGIVYQFYYEYGDCINYYIAAKEYLAYIVQHPEATFDFIFLTADTLYDKYPDFLNTTVLVLDYFNDANIFIHRFTLLFGFPSMFYFFPCNLFFSLVAFWGCWKLYNVLSTVYPQFEKYCKISFLFLPSIVFWTAGIGKDALCIGFVNLFVAFMIEAFILKRKAILNTLFAIISAYIVFKVKSYIILSLVPFFLYYLLSFSIKKFKSNANKFLARVLLICLILLSTVGVLVFTNITEIISTEIIGGALNLTKGQQNTNLGNESKYDLGITINDIKEKNVAPFIIPSVIVSLFRPYLWEVNKPLIIFSFLESCFFLLLTFYVFLRGRIYYTIKIIMKDEFLLFAIGFSIVFAFFVGLVSANFGTLIRYKTPFIGYYMLALFIVKKKLETYLAPTIKPSNQ